MRPFDLVNKIRILNPHANIDELYGPYESLQEAILAIPLELRILGRTVGIITGNSIEEYWWKEDTSDIGLILKIADVSVPTKTSDLQNDGEDGLNPFITAQDISTKAEVDASNLTPTDVVNWRTALDIYSKSQIDTALTLKLDKPTADGSWVITKLGSTITYTNASTFGQNISNSNLTWSADRTQNLNAKKLSFTGGRVSVPALELEITAENSVPNKIWTDGTTIYRTNNLGINASLEDNIATANLTSTGERTFTQGFSFIWSTAGKRFDITGLLDKTGQAVYSKVLTQNPATGEVTTRDFADPSALTLAIQNTNGTQLTAIRTKIFGSSTPAPPVLNNALPSFIKVNEQTEIDLIGLNLTLLDPTAIYIVHPTTQEKIYASAFFNRSSTVITSVWNLPSDFPVGLYDIKIQIQTIPQGLSSAKLKVVDNYTEKSLLTSDWMYNGRTDANGVPIPFVNPSTFYINNNLIKVSGAISNQSSSRVLPGAISIKSSNFLDGSKDWLIRCDMTLLSVGGYQLGIFPSFGISPTANSEFTAIDQIIELINILGGVETMMSNGTTSFSARGQELTLFSIFIEKSGTDVLFKCRRQLPGGAVDVFTRLFPNAINTSQFYSLFIHEYGWMGDYRVVTYEFKKIYQS